MVVVSCEMKWDVKCDLPNFDKKKYGWKIYHYLTINHLTMKYFSLKWGCWKEIERKRGDGNLWERSSSSWDGDGSWWLIFISSSTISSSFLIIKLTPSQTKIKKRERKFISQLLPSHLSSSHLTISSTTLMDGSDD